jgi:hypothetical protein
VREIKAYLFVGQRTHPLHQFIQLLSLHGI